MDKYTVLDYLIKRKSDADYALRDFANRLITETIEQDLEIKELKSGLMKKKKRIDLVKPVISLDDEIQKRINVNVLGL